MTDTHSGHGDHGTMLNGHSIDEVVTFFQGAYQPVHKDTGGMSAPVIDRQKRIQANSSALEDAIKGVLGDSDRADKPKAESVVKKLAYELAKATDEYHGEEDKFTDKQVRQYLTAAANATGNPTVGNKLAFIKAIQDMDSAKPGSLGYDPNSAMAQLIGYIATQKDEEAKKINYFRTIAAEHWTEPETGIKLQQAFSGKLGINLAGTATANDLFSHMERVYSVKNQAAQVESAPKTYLAPAAHGHGGAHAHH